MNIAYIGICGSDIHVNYGKHPMSSIRLFKDTRPAVSGCGREKITRVRVGDLVTIEPQVYCGKCYPCTHGLYNICNNLKVWDSRPSVQRAITLQCMSGIL